MTGVRIIDDFLPSPESYLNSAEQMDFRSYQFENCAFHGISVSSLDGIVPRLLKEKFPSLSPCLTFFRKSPEGQEEPHYIHTDIDMGEWSAILYLNRFPPDGDGTLFWTHRDTGAIESTIPHERSEEGRSEAGWHVNFKVNSVFNRLLLFPARFFHSRSIHDNWGKGNDARLTQVTFGTGAIG